jgi:uncharacterized protein YcaQ
VHELSRTDARRIAVRAQLLGSERPAGLVEMVRELTMIQIDSTNAGSGRRTPRPTWPPRSSGAR